MDADALLAEVLEAWRPPPRLTLSQWADRHAVLSAESSAEQGKWRTIPFQRGIMDAITDRRIESVSVMKSARVGWTKILNHMTGYHIQHDPCPIMIVQPTIEDAKGYSKDEIEPMLRDTSALDGLVDENKRDSGNTIQLKRFPGGSLRLVGANSPGGFRRVTVRIVGFDEVDGYPPTAGEEGDQIKLGIMRTQTFWNRKIIAGSTPTRDATSRIKRRFEMGNMQYYLVPCPFCKQPQVLKFAQFKWDKGQPETVRYICEHCSEPIGFNWQRWMVEEADRLHLAGDLRYGWVPTNKKPKDPRHASFHIWAAYSYSPNATWAHIVKEWLESHKNVEERMVFINTVLGETYKGEGDSPDWKKLYDRREPYKTNIVPAGGLALYAGVDVQKDRLELEIVAYGRRMESWSVDYRVINGDPSQLDGPDSPWSRLTEILNESFRHELGGHLKIRKMGIDTGYLTNVVYQYCRRHSTSRVLALDPRDRYGQIIGQPKDVEVSVRGRRLRRGVKLWPIGVSGAKQELYGWLKQERPTKESGAELPYGYCHFPEYGEEFFKGITAEEEVPRLVKGFRRYQWEKNTNGTSRWTVATTPEQVPRWTAWSDGRRKHGRTSRPSWAP